MKKSKSFGGEEAKARSRHHSLMEDYMDLVKEVEAKRKELLKANKKKLKLSAVVKFLRRKLKGFSKIPSQRMKIKVKKNFPKLLPLLSDETKVPLKDSQEVRETRVPKIANLFDLNQIVPAEQESPSTDIRHVTLEENLAACQSQLAIKV